MCIELLQSFYVFILPPSTKRLSERDFFGVFVGEVEKRVANCVVLVEKLFWNRLNVEDV
jgi:hypothetical protein